MWKELSEKFKKNKAEDIRFSSFDDTVEGTAAIPAPDESEEGAAPAPASVIGTATHDAAGNIELKLARPSCFEDVSGIADHLLAGRTVVLNLELIKKEDVLRMLDFLNGVTYATDGEIRPISASSYIITPHNVDVSDDAK